MMCAIASEQPGRTHVYKLLTLCGECGRLSGDGEAACERCGSDDSTLVSDVGTVYSYCVVREGTASSVLALVRLADGPLVMGRLIGVDRGLKIGMPVEFVFRPLSFAEGGSGGGVFSPAGVKLVVSDSTHVEEESYHVDHFAR